jgi:predicted transcriptional regulator
MPFADAAPSDVVDALVKRNDFLSCVLEEPRETPELVEELGVSRSTVDRGMSALETAGLVESCNKGYRTTSIGGVVTTDFLAFMESVEKASRDRGRTREDVPAVDIVSTVSSRQPVLESLQAEPKDKPTLVDELGMSRSTIDRSVRELETQGLVEYSDGEFMLTPVGASTVSGLSDLRDMIQLQQRLEPVLKWVPDGELDIDLELLADAEVILPESGDPWAMVNRHVKLLKQVNEGCAVLPLAGLHACEAIHDRITNEGAVFEIVVNPDVAGTLQSNPDYTELVDEMLETGRHDIYVYEGEIPYFVGLLNDTVQIGVDEEGEPRAILETDSPEVADWAEGKYEEYKQQSQKLT